MFSAVPPEDLSAYVNVEEGAARLGGNLMIYKKILGSYVNKPVYPALKDALARKDFADAELQAHTLKGVAGNLSLAAVFRLATELDGLLKKGETSAGLEAQLEEAVAKTDEYVKWVQENLQ